MVLTFWVFRGYHKNMTLINQILAEDVNISTLYNPAKNLIGVTTLGGLFSNDKFSLINFIFIIIGLLFFANLVIAGWGFMLSSGDPKKTQTASLRLTNGFFGLILAILAFVIVNLITNVLGLGDRV